MALEVSGTQPQMNYSAGLFSECKNNNNGYAYVGKSVGLGVSGKASSNATERGSKRAAALIISGAEAHSATCSPYAHRCSFSKVLGPDGGGRTIRTGEINSCQKR